MGAAHCAAKFQQEPTKLKIRCGEWDTQNQTEPRPHQDRYVQTLDIHPEFNPRNLANDWAVLYTAQNFDLQAHIDTICLPQPEELFDFQTWSARASLTQLHTSRLASLPGVSDVGRTTHQVSMPPCPRVSAGSTTP